MRPPVDLTGCTFSCAIFLIWSASSCSRRLAGSSDETSQPAPKAMSPAASGLPRVCRRTSCGTSCGADAGDGMSVRVQGVAAFRRRTVRDCRLAGIRLIM